MEASVTVHMHAPPDRVWSLVSDVTKTGKFSPETFDAEWLDGATGPELGGRFRGHVRRNGNRWLVYWSTCTITKCEPGRDFEFQTELPSGKPVVRWRYQLQPRDGGTEVTESFELLEYFGSRLYSKLAEKARTRTNVNNMKATLERIKAVAELPGEDGQVERS